MLDALRAKWFRRTKADLLCELLVAKTRLEDAQRQLGESKDREAYWRTRCERLSDQRLFRTGEIASPVFEDPQPSMRSGSPITDIFGALSVTEIDSSRRHG